MAKSAALKWLDKNYDIPSEEAYRNMLDYLFEGQELKAIRTFSTWFLGRRFYSVAAIMVHEMVEASELKRKFGHVNKKIIPYADQLAAHYIAVQYEIKYLKDLRRYDLVRKVKKREGLAEKLRRL